MTTRPSLSPEQIDVLQRAAKRDGWAPTYRAAGVDQTTFTRALTGARCPAEASSSYERSR